MFSIDLQKYQPLGEITDPKELIQNSNPEMLPLALTWNSAAGSIGANEIYTADKKEITLADNGEAQLSFTCVRPDGVTLVRTFTFKGDSYRLDMAATVKNQGASTTPGESGPVSV